MILAGDEVALAPLQAALTDRTKELVGDVLRVDIRPPRDEVAAEIAPVLRRMEADASAAIADQVVAAVRSDGLSVAGLEATREALGNGQVELLLLDASADLDDEHRNDLLRLAATTGADVDVVEGHPGLSRFGGVGACSAIGWTDRRAAAWDPGRPSQPCTRPAARVPLAIPRRSAR